MIAHIRPALGENLHSKNKTKENVVMKKVYKIFLISTMSLMLALFLCFAEEGMYQHSQSEGVA